MIYDLQASSEVTARQADIVVVGSGAAGISLAVELARLGRQVILLEGGGAALEASSQEVYQAEQTGLGHRGIHHGRFRVHGGTTTQWGGQILELEDADFEKHSWISGSGWPFRKAELAPFYARALELEGIQHSMLEDRQVWRALGEAPPNLDQVELYLSRWCPEPNFARLHRSTLEANPRVQVWLHANAVELALDAYGCATGVRCRTLSGKEVVFQAKQYVFALGAIESCRFFLQPRPQGTLPWNASGLLGRHFQDHIDADAATLRPKATGAFHQIFDSIFLRGFKYNPKLRLSRHVQQQEQVLIAGATVFSVSELDSTLTDLKATAKYALRGRFQEIRWSQLPTLLRHAPLIGRQALRFALDHRSYHPPEAEIRLRVHCEQEPLSASSIRLGPERDQLGQLRAAIDWRISELELRSIRVFVQNLQKALAPFAEIVPHPDLHLGDRFLAHCQDSFHHMGGMRMDASAAAGVVTPDLRLHNTKNVFVCSSAVFPTSGFSNPTHTLLALAVRLAAHLGTLT